MQATCLHTVCSVQMIQACSAAFEYFISLSEGPDGHFEQELTLLRIQGCLLTLAKQYPDTPSTAALQRRMAGMPGCMLMHSTLNCILHHCDL